ncbi:tetratricopeptide repeat protein [Leptolyngbya sp. KIOST-1]|uniref:tetratricopeptide repeat protein n=1 Tax=Leptolyngbya sp. KIOST-1 TaxID=1229172 RepID=UPI000567A0D2|nr:tetratricopeptide repeat protein [Leptolyngbya sp. KIOST-1]
MKVSRQSANLLTLRSRSWTLWLISPSLVVIGLVVGTVAVGKSVLQCDRATTGQCTLTHSNTFNQKTQTFPITDLEEAEVFSSRNSEGDSRYLVLLQTNQGSIEFNRGYSDDWFRANNQADRVNRFLQTQTMSRLYLREDNRWLGWLFMLCFSGVGLLMLLNTKVMTCSFDKSANRFSLRLVGLTGSRQYQGSLQQILGMRLDLLSQAREDDDDSIGARLAIVLKNGETIPFAKVYSGDADKLAVVIRQVNDFLRLPPLPAWDAADALKAQTKIALPMVTGGAAQRQTAMAESQQALRQNPDDVEAYQRLATALSMQGKKDQAQQLLETARIRFQSRGDWNQAAYLDYVLGLLRLKGKTHWWEAC